MPPVRPGLHAGINMVSQASGSIESEFFCIPIYIFWHSRRALLNSSNISNLTKHSYCFLHRQRNTINWQSHLLQKGSSITMDRAIMNPAYFMDSEPSRTSRKPAQKVKEDSASVYSSKTSSDSSSMLVKPDQREGKLQIHDPILRAD